MPIGYLCQWISYAVFAVVSVCCVPVSLADVLARSAFRAVCAVLWRRLSVSCWLDIPTRQGHGCTVPQRFSFFAFEKPLCIGKLLFQLRQNFVLQVFDFYRLILHLYHQISHMAELCHINIKRRFRRHIFFSDKVLQKIFCFCHNTTEQNSTETTFSSYLETFKSGAFRLVRS